MISYAVDFRRSLLRADPLMPILGVVAGIAATVFALNCSGAARSTFTWTGVGFIGLVVVASITIAEADQLKVPPCSRGAKLPERAGHYRIVWRRFHAWQRTLAALAALCLPRLGSGRNDRMARTGYLPGMWSELAQGAL